MAQVSITSFIFIITGTHTVLFVIKFLRSMQNTNATGKMERISDFLFAIVKSFSIILCDFRISIFKSLLYRD